jgi:ABC-type glutathione transport system ATPase component
VTDALEVRGLRHAYAGRVVVEHVDLTLAPGEILGLVGGSGAGKSTIARCIAGLERPLAGSVCVAGRPFPPPRRHGVDALPRLQMVFQDPYASLDPRRPIGWSVAQPLRIQRLPPGRIEERVRSHLRAVGLEPDDARRYPHEFSGGQRQRIAIARALAPDPAVVIADEPVSALDVSIRAQILNLVLDLRAARQTAWLLISHDLDVIRHVADRVAILADGVIVETGACADVLTRPRHAATQRLLAAALPEPGG